MTSGLTEHDLKQFAAMGVSAPWLEEAQVRRVTTEQAREAGIRFSGDLTGVLYSRIDPVTGIVVGGRLRRDHPEVNQDGKPCHKYVSSFGDRPRLYFAPGARELLRETTVAVVFVEAEKSVLAVVAAAQREGRRLLVVGTGGCWGWRGTRGMVTDATGARVPEKRPLPDLDRIEWTDREVTIAFDSNCDKNTKVQRARQALAAELAKHGAKVCLADLPVEEDINGPDDFISAHGAAALFKLFDDAKPYDREKQQAGRGRTGHSSG